VIADEFRNAPPIVGPEAVDRRKQADVLKRRPRARLPARAEREIWYSMGPEVAGDRRVVGTMEDAINLLERLQRSDVLLEQSSKIIARK
jgi:hypothetical protein